jgi:hypothetical protein
MTVVGVVAEYKLVDNKLKILTIIKLLSFNNTKYMMSRIARKYVHIIGQ